LGRRAIDADEECVYRQQQDKVRELQTLNNKSGEQLE